MTDIRLYNTLTRQKDVLAPADPNRVTMYVCGPTVYNRAHIGNARPAVVFDVLYRLLRHKYGADAVVYARNFTDIDDKIMAAADAEGVPIETITQRYEDFYLADMGALGVLPPTIQPRATGHVGQMVAMIAALIDKGAAYAAEGHVLFDVTKDAEYGTLSRRPMDEMIAGARVEVAPYKRNPGDFVLWKPSTDAQPGWDSPWGRGRPGWHIECSAMIEAHLGTTIDIHGGGLDLQFPHHENECAQSRCAHDGKPLAKIWMHNGFLSMDKEKMSKSLGNVVTVGELLAQGHKGETLRLALLMAHYRQPLDWNERLIEQAKATLDRWYRLLDEVVTLKSAGDMAEVGVSDRFLVSLEDDLNTPEAIAILHEQANEFRGLRGDWVHGTSLEQQMLAVARDRFVNAGRMLGILQNTPEEWFGRISPQTLISETHMTSASLSGPADVIRSKIDARIAAKAAKNWAEADRIRDELKAEGIVLEDKPDGTTVWRRA